MHACSGNLCTKFHTLSFRTTEQNRFIRSTFCQLNYHHLKAISRLIYSARYNRFQLLSLVNKNVNRINRPLRLLQGCSWCTAGGPHGYFRFTLLVLYTLNGTASAYHSEEALLPNLFWPSWFSFV